MSAIPALRSSSPVDEKEDLSKEKRVAKSTLNGHKAALRASAEHLSAAAAASQTATCFAENMFAEFQAKPLPLLTELLVSRSGDVRESVYAAAVQCRTDCDNILELMTGHRADTKKEKPFPDFYKTMPYYPKVGVIDKTVKKCSVDSDKKETVINESGRKYLTAVFAEIDRLPAQSADMNPGLPSLWQDVIPRIDSISRPSVTLARSSLKFELVHDVEDRSVWMVKGAGLCLYKKQAVKRMALAELAHLKLLRELKPKHFLVPKVVAFESGEDKYTTYMTCQPGVNYMDLLKEVKAGDFGKMRTAFHAMGKAFGELNSQLVTPASRKQKEDLAEVALSWHEPAVAVLKEHHSVPPYTATELRDRVLYSNVHVSLAHDDPSLTNVLWDRRSHVVSLIDMGSVGTWHNKYSKEVPAAAMHKAMRMMKIQMAFFVGVPHKDRDKLAEAFEDGYRATLRLDKKRAGLDIFRLIDQYQELIALNESPESSKNSKQIARLLEQMHKEKQPLGAFAGRTPELKIVPREFKSARIVPVHLSLKESSTHVIRDGRSFPANVLRALGVVK